MSDAHALETMGLQHSYGERRALAGVDLQVAPGAIMALLGPNGSGKTTLFRIITTLLIPTGGSAQVFGHDVAQEPAAVRRTIGVVFQTPALDAQLSVRENLHLQGALYGLRGAALTERSEELLQRVGIADRANDRVGTLSGGLARRADLARGLLHRPRLLLLDEPGAALDVRARRELMELLRSEGEAGGTTVLMTTHLMEQAAACDRVAMLDAGRLVADGAPEALCAELERDVVRVRARDAEAMSAALRERFGLEPQVIDGTVRIEHPRGDAFIPELIEAMRGEVTEVTLARPTLEDVFIRKTGRLLQADGERAA